MDRHVFPAEWAGHFEFAARPDHGIGPAASAAGHEAEALFHDIASSLLIRWNSMTQTQGLAVHP